MDGLAPPPGAHGMTGFPLASCSACRLKTGRPENATKKHINSLPEFCCGLGSLRKHTTCFFFFFTQKAWHSSLYPLWLTWPCQFLADLASAKLNCFTKHTLLLARLTHFLSSVSDFSRIWGYRLGLFSSCYLVTDLWTLSGLIELDPQKVLNLLQRGQQQQPRFQATKLCGEGGGSSLRQFTLGVSHSLGLSICL